MANVCDVNLANKLGKKEATKVFAEFQEFIKKNNITDGDTLVKDMTSILEERVKKITMTQQERMISKVKAEQLSKTLASVDPKKGVKKFEDILESTNDKTAATKQGFFTMLSDISTPEYGKLFKDKNFQFEVFKRLSTNVKSANEAVESAANSFRKAFNFLFKAKQAAGLQMDSLATYAGKQMHSSVKIVEDSINWTNFATESFDFQAMGIKPDQVDSFIGDMFKRAKNPKYLIDGEFTEIQFGSVAGMQESRVIKFKSVEAEYEYMNRYGGGDFLSNALKTVERESRVVGLSSTFGPRHEATFEQTVNFLAQQSGGRLDELKSLKTTYDYLRGRNQYARPSTVFGKGAVLLRKMTDMSKLSAMSAVSTVTDIPFMAGVSETLLGGGARGYARNLLNFTTGMISTVTNKADAKKWANRLAVYAEDVNPLLDRSSLRDFMEAGVSWKTFDQAHRTVMNLTGLPRQNWAAKIQASKMFSHGLADMSTLPLDKMTKKTQAMFESFGITAKDWDNIRLNALEDIDGDNILSPAKLFEAGDTEAGIKLAGFLKQAAELGSPTQSAKMAAFKKSFDPDSPIGMAALAITQFKSFPFSVYKTMSTVASASNPYANVAATAAISTGLGATVIQLREYAKKGKFKEVDARFAFDAFAQGGAGGLVADFLTADYSTKWRTLQGDLLGPSFGTIADMAYMGSKIRNKITGTGNAPTTKEWARFTWYNTPSILYAPATYKYFEKFIREF